MTPKLMLVPELGLEYIGVPENSGKHVVHVVGEATGQPANGFHFLSVNEFLARLYLKGDVPRQPEDTDDLALFAQWLQMRFEVPTHERVLVGHRFPFEGAVVHRDRQ